tara:strand:- start:111 stop:425 length:315 start_codon:yes stop_codon:yes gene_type:complete
MKSIYIILLIIFTLSCQREERNQLGVGYNKTLIMPPTNDLPTPTSIKEDKSTIKNSNNNVINSILDQSNMEEIDPLIIDKIDEESGYNSDENFFQWLFKGQSKR